MSFKYVDPQINSSSFLIFFNMFLEALSISNQGCYPKSLKPPLDISYKTYAWILSLILFIIRLIISRSSHHAPIAMHTAQHTR